MHKHTNFFSFLLALILLLLLSVPHSLMVGMGPDKSLLLCYMTSYKALPTGGARGRLWGRGRWDLLLSVCFLFQWASLQPQSFILAALLIPAVTVSSNVQCAHTPELASRHPLRHQHQLDSDPSQRSELQLWEAPHPSLISNNHIFWSSNFRSGSCFLKLLSPGYCRVSPFAFSVL